MSRHRAGTIPSLSLSIALITASILTACAHRPPHEFAGHYTIALAGPGQQSLSVRARLTGLTPGLLELAMLRRWAGFTDLDVQLRWIQLLSKGGQAKEMPPAQGTLASREQDVLCWSVQVPEDGTLQLVYHIDLNGRDGEVPSWVGEEQALLLTRSLFVFPLDWLDQLQAPFQGSVQVQVLAPSGWSVYAPWPTTATGAAFLPETPESLFDAALILGVYTTYELRDDGFRARILLPSTQDEAHAYKRANELAHGMIAAYRLFGIAPNLGATADLLAAIIPQWTSDGGVVSVALADNLILAQTATGLPPSVNEVITRETVRLWIAHALRTAPRWSADPYSREPWITYGWTDYLAWLIRLNSGQLSPLQYWAHLRRLVKDLADSPLVNVLTLAEMTNQMREDPSLSRLVYAKAHLGALLLDRRLQAETRGQVNLLSVARQACRQLNYYATGQLASSEQVLMLLSDLSGHDYVEFYTRLMHRAGPLDLSNVPELSGPPVGETRILSTPDGLRLFYQWLDGPSQHVAIFLSDGPGRPPYDFLYRMAQPLQQYVDLAYLEQRGSGRSQALGQGAYSLDAYLNDVELLREQLGVRQITLIGHGWGGFCALQYAQRYPERVRALVLLAPILSFPSFARATLENLMAQASQENDAWAAHVWRLSAQGIHTYADLATLWRLLERVNGKDQASAQEAVRKAYEHYVKIFVLPEGLPLSNDEILPVLIARDGLLKRELLSELVPGAYPTLILYGERDRTISRSLLATLRQRLGAELKEIANAGHYVYLDDPEAAFRAIAAFIELH